MQPTGSRNRPPQKRKGTFGLLSLGKCQRICLIVPGPSLPHAGFLVLTLPSAMSVLPLYQFGYYSHLTSFLGICFPLILFLPLPSPHNSKHRVGRREWIWKTRLRSYFPSHLDPSWLSQGITTWEASWSLSDSLAQNKCNYRADLMGSLFHWTCYPPKPNSK